MCNLADILSEFQLSSGQPLSVINRPAPAKPIIRMQQGNILTYYKCAKMIQFLL